MHGATIRFIVLYIFLNLTDLPVPFLTLILLLLLLFYICKGFTIALQYHGSLFIDVTLKVKQNCRMEATFLTFWRRNYYFFNFSTSCI